MQISLRKKEVLLRASLKMLLVMKLTAFFLVIACIHVSAAGFSQKINLSLKNASLSTVFSKVEKQSGYKFFYDKKSLKEAGQVTIDFKEGTLKEFMDKLTKAQGLSYEILDKTIVVRINPVSEVSSIERNALPSTLVHTDPDVQRADLRLQRPVLERATYVAPVDIRITGRVADEKGDAVPGVSVVVKGSPRGTVTDADGNYSLEVPNTQAILVFSFVGYVPQEVPVGNRTRIDLTLNLDEQKLDEIVVVGYGTQRVGDVTSSIATIKAENFVKGPVKDAGQLLQGKVAGLTISSPSGNPVEGTQILLRGNTTLFGANSNPLVIIDGVPGALNTVAPEDIESIDVLKDGSAAAIYGVRGTNGVIIITTKRARGQESSVVEYSGNMSVQSIARKLDMLTAQDYRQQIAAGTRDASWDLGANTDWMDEVTQTPLTNVHNLTFRGGSNRTNYIASANYRYLEGIFKKSDNSTFTGRIDINHSMLNDKLLLNVSLLNQVTSFTQTQDGGSFNGYTYRQALIRNPTSPIYDAEGKWHEQTGNFNYENPLARLYESDGKTKTVNSRMNASLTYNPTNNLRFNALVSYSRFNNNAGYAETKQHISNLRDNMNGYAAIGSALSIDRLLEITGQYSKQFGKHRGSILGGYGYQENDYSSNFLRNFNFPTDIFSYHNIGLGNALTDGKATIGSSRTETNLISFFSRLTYSFDDKYLLMGSVRHEGASQLFGADKPWGTFAAASLGWRITNESFMEDQTLFDDLKLRVGYGITGNPPSTSFLSQALLGYGGYIYSNGSWVRSLGPTTNPNPNIRWEEKHETNVGLDFMLKKGRISGSIDYYVRNIKGLLYDFQVPSPPNLFTTTRANVGVMENKGLEAIVTYIPVRKKDLEWSTTLTFSTNSNKLVSLSNDLYQTTNDYFTTGGTGEPIQTFTNIVFIGQGIGDFYGFKVVDIDANGKWIYENPSGERVSYENFAHSFEDKQVLGNGLPKYYAGWNNNVRYKRFDAGVTMRGAFKYQILNFQRMYFENPSIVNYNRLKSSTDPVYGKALLTAPLEFNSYYLEDGDFWKIDNITAGYNFPVKNKQIKAFRVYASTLNTFTITGYKGIDPEVNRMGLNPGNDDRDKYPTTRTYTLGINLTF
jgi:TonB-linked SusC/RagA family outer membrane protein